MCPLAAQPYRMPQVGYDIWMAGSFLGPLMCPLAAQPGRMPQVSYTIFARVAVLSGPLMCPLAAQPGRMPHRWVPIEAWKVIFVGPLMCLLTRCQIIRWMRSSRVITASDCQCQSRNSPGFDPSLLLHRGIWRAADEAVLNKNYT
jgi:hypothetical protein